MTPVDVTVLLGSRFDGLRTHGTRWRAVLGQWAADPRVRRLQVVDYPRFRPGRARVHSRSGWLDNVTVLDVTVPLPRRTTPFDAVGWAVAGRAVRRAARTEGGIA